MRRCLLLLFLWVTPALGAVEVQVYPSIEARARSGNLEVQLAPSLEVGYSLSCSLFDTYYAVVPSSRAITLRMWGSPFNAPPKPGYWIIAYDVENRRTYEGESIILSRVHFIGNQTRFYEVIPCDLVTFEYRLTREIRYGYHDRAGHVTPLTRKSEGFMYLGKRIGPIFLTIGASKAPFALKARVSL